MNKFIVAGFRDETKAYEGVRALKELHAEGSVTVYGTAVVQRDAKGSLAIKQWSDRGPVGLGVGALVGGLIGMFGGPVGAVIGMAGGGLVGTWRDLLHAEVSDEFLEALEKELAPGRFAVVAEVSEEWTTPIDVRMEALGGIVVRTWREDFVEDLIEKRVAARKAEVAKWREALAGGRVSPMQSKLAQQIDEARKNLQSVAEKARERLDHTKEEMGAKLQALEAQAVKAKPEIKNRVQQRITEIRKDFGEREKKLTRACELMKEALHP